MCSGGGRGGGVGRVMLVGEWAGARLDGECSLTTRGIYWGARRQGWRALGERPRGPLSFRNRILCEGGGLLLNLNCSLWTGGVREMEKTKITSHCH